MFGAYLFDRDPPKTNASKPTSQVQENALTFAYDADGELIKRTENGQTTLVLHKQLEHNLSTGLYKKYYYFHGQVIALREGLNLLNPVTFFVADHLGSIRTTLWAGGSKRSDLRYDPWGKVRWSQTNYTIPTGHRYTSQRWEDKLGLYDYHARYYDPTTARFLSADTLVPDPVIPVKRGRTPNSSTATPTSLTTLQVTTTHLGIVANLDNVWWWGKVGEVTGMQSMLLFAGGSVANPDHRAAPRTRGRQGQP